jgi:hypothetical protein
VDEVAPLIGDVLMEQAILLHRFLTESILFVPAVQAVSELLPQTISARFPQK